MQGYTQDSVSALDLKDCQLCKKLLPGLLDLLDFGVRLQRLLQGLGPLGSSSSQYRRTPEIVL